MDFTIDLMCSWITNGIGVNFSRGTHRIDGNKLYVYVWYYRNVLDICVYNKIVRSRMLLSKIYTMIETNRHAHTRSVHGHCITIHKRLWESNCWTTKKNKIFILSVCSMRISVAIGQFVTRHVFSSSKPPQFKWENICFSDFRMANTRAHFLLLDKDMFQKSIIKCA